MNLYREYGTKLLLHHLAAVDAAAADPRGPVAVTPAKPAAASERPDRLDARAA